MKQRSFAFITILVLIIAVIPPLQTVYSMTSNVFVPAPELAIIYPLNVTYSGEMAQEVPLMIYANVLVDAPAVVSLSYSLDESANITFTALGKTGEFPSESGKAVAYHTEMLSLSNLTDGTHILKTYSIDIIGSEMKNSVEFTVDSTINTTITPTPTIPESSTLILVITFLLIAILLRTVMIKRKQSIGG